MEWIRCLQNAIDYMEEHLLDIEGPDEVAAHVHISCMYLQNGFRVLTGYSLGEYMRNRKLYLAAVELQHTSTPIIDIALKYGYETPGSFDKAFVRYHGVTPMDVRKARGNIKTFLRMNVSVSVQGGDSMEFRIEKKDGIKVVGFQRRFDSETSYVEIPKYWEKCISTYAPHLMNGMPADEAEIAAIEKYIKEHGIGEFGICIDDIGVNGQFDYMIAGRYDDGDVPEEMRTWEIPSGEWAVFDCSMATLQDTNTKVWKEWLPTNGEYELRDAYNVEWYSQTGDFGPTQKCQLWFPVKRKSMQE